MQTIYVMLLGMLRVGASGPLLDELADRTFVTDTKRYLLQDLQDTPNDITRWLQSDISVIVLSAKKGEFEQGYYRGRTKEDLLTASEITQHTIVVLTNEPSKERCAEIESLLGVPVCLPDVLIPTLTQLDAKEDTKPTEEDNMEETKPTEAMEVCRITVSSYAIVDGKSYLTGRVVTGTVQVNDALTRHDGSTIVVRRVFLHHMPRQQARKGDIVLLQVEGLEVGRAGDVVASTRDACTTSRVITATLHVHPGFSFRRAMLYLHTGVTECDIRPGPSGPSVVYIHTTEHVTYNTDIPALRQVVLCDKGAVIATGTIVS
jgi:hypothetical protein